MVRTAPPSAAATPHRDNGSAVTLVHRDRTIEPRVQSVRVTGVAFLHSARAGIGPAVRRFGVALRRLSAGVTVLWFLVRHVGAAPFEDGLRAVTWRAVVAAVTLTALTTVCSAWRWRVVARALGVDIGLPSATGAYYRSLFLNSVLPGGVLGDVHRAVTHGRRAGDVARGVRAVGTAVRSGHPGRGDRRRAADPALAGSARAAVRSGGSRGRSRVRCTGRRCRRSPRPGAGDPRPPGRCRRTAAA